MLITRTSLTESVFTDSNTVRIFVIRWRIDTKKMRKIITKIRSIIIPDWNVVTFSNNFLEKKEVK